MKYWRRSIIYRFDCTLYMFIYAKYEPKAYIAYVTRKSDMTPNTVSRSIRVYERKYRSIKLVQDGYKVPQIYWVFIFLPFSYFQSKASEDAVNNGAYDLYLTMLIIKRRSFNI